jgi:hypothetical protein
MMTSRVVSLAGKKWLLGLEWNTHQDLPTKDELIEEAETGNHKVPNRNWYAIRQGEHALQSGFCTPLEGVQSTRKLYSLAAMLADAKKEPWLGIFIITPEGTPDADKRWWYIAVRNSYAILPDGDAVGNKEDIQRLREQHAGMGGWNYVDGDLRTLEAMLKDMDKHQKPTPIYSLDAPLWMRVSPWTYGAVAGAVVIAVSGAGWYHWEAKKAEDAARIAKAREMARKAAADSLAAVPIAVDPEFSRRPTPAQWLSACSGLIQHQVMADMGWVISGVNCNLSAVEIVRARGKGADVLQKPNGVLSPDGNSNTSTFPLPKLVPNSASGAQPGEIAASRLLLQAWGQKNGIVVSMAEPEKPAALPGAKAEDSATIPPPKFTFSFVTHLPFSGKFAADMAEVPGLRLTSLTFVANGWNVGGVVYGRR